MRGPALVSGAFLSTLALTLGQVATQSARLEPRDGPDKYPASAVLATGSRLAAEFLGRSIPVAGGMEFAHNHVVIEVAMFPPANVKKADTVLSANQWTLIVNRARIPLLAETPGMVASSIKYPDSEGPGLTATGAVGNAGIIVGAPSRRYPSDIDPRRGPRRPAGVPEEEDRSGVRKQAAPPLEEQLKAVSLIEGETSLPVAGVIFFRFTGKLSKIKSLELVYQAQPGNEVRITLPKPGF